MPDPDHRRAPPFRVAVDGESAVWPSGTPVNSGLDTGAAGVTTTLGWRQTCACPAHQPVPAVVLDCFSGSGTTLMVADRLGRHALGCELKSDYAAMSKRRVTGDAPLFADVTLEGGDPEPLEPAPSDARTKQERYPNRTVAGFNQRWKAKHGPVVEGAAG